jgi:hypothetical protein
VVDEDVQAFRVDLDKISEALALVVSGQVGGDCLNVAKFGQ